MRIARLTLMALALLAGMVAVTATAHAAAPAWNLSITPMPSNFKAGADPEPEYVLLASNVGGAPSNGEPILLQASVPKGLVPTEAAWRVSLGGGKEEECEIEALPEEEHLVACEIVKALGPGRNIIAQVKIDATGPPGTYTTTATVEGGGAPFQTSASSPTKVQAQPLPFDFLAGFKAPLTAEEGTAATAAGSHPFQQTVSFGFPTAEPGDGLTNAGHPRDFTVSLPRGLVGNPTALPVLCTEAELTGLEGCPEDSQAGLANITTLGGIQGVAGIATSPLYAMVPPPGNPAVFATNIAQAGIFSHILASVRTEGDYGVDAITPDVLAFGSEPIFSVQAQVWGDVAAASHDGIRGACLQSGNANCVVKEDNDIAFLTLPADCPGTPLLYKASADTWEEPEEDGFEPRRTSYESADLAGNPVTITGCGEAPFEPSISIEPETNVSDSPTGLDFNLHQAQHTAISERGSAPLEDATIAFPPGMTVNPSQAAGLGACSLTQIGFNGPNEEGGLSFSKNPQSCPDDSKLGTVTVTSPVLAARDEEQKVEEKEGKVVPEPLHGAIYLAEPFANPFDSLIAIYIALEDPQTGIVAKLAGEGALDPDTGQITTRVTHSPELPIEDFSVHLFGGSRAPLITPPTCGAATATSELVPWSAPEGEAEHPEGSFTILAAPGGGPCPASPAAMPHSPAFSAGTLSPQAAKYSPLIFKLSREDGSQRLGRIEATLPAGLVAKLAGVGECTEAEIAKARSREAPEMGALEQAEPSCPASSEIGTILGAAGAGPKPFYTTGHAYLAGPYAGAPLSAVAIVPALAGPFVIGTVVSRIALHLDPVSARVRAVSDPLPQMLDGVPVDLRRISLRTDRPEFSLNPTSCDTKHFEGQALSALGLPAPLSERFQVGGCSALAFKPRFSLRLSGPTNRGAHPALRLEATAKPGEANLARTVLALPRSEFIDQAHFRTICTRVQFAAGQCPAGSVYGRVRAFSPLLDYPLEGPVYLRSSDQELPDTVLALRGPPLQPLAFEVTGHVDSVKGRLRVTVPNVPDAPISKVVVKMQGARKGLFQNSTELCRGTHRATLKLTGQNGKALEMRPPLKAKCKHRHPKRKKRSGRR
jgi:hypothetical protein